MVRKNDTVAAVMFLCGILLGFVLRFDVIKEPEPGPARVSPPSQKAVAEYIEQHNGSAPPVSWYPNGDPWRNIPAEESNEMLKDCEVKK